MLPPWLLPTVARSFPLPARPPFRTAPLHHAAQFDGIFASSRHIPGVRFPGLIHPGLIGTAPSHELLKIWNDREGALVENGPEALTLGGHLHTRPLGTVAVALSFCLLQPCWCSSPLLLPTVHEA